MPSVGCSFLTAVQDLYHPARLGLVEPPAKVSGEDWILLYGGSCACIFDPRRFQGADPLQTPTAAAVGQSLIQLAHASGYKIVTMASPRNFDLVRALGADEFVDRGTGDWVESVYALTGDRGADVVLEVVGGAHLGECVRAAAVGGRVCQIGALGGQWEVSAPAMPRR